MESLRQPSPQEASSVQDRETDLGLDRINFAIALREYGLLADFEDWDGLSDYEVLGLVCAHHPRHYPEFIVSLWKSYCSKEDEHEV